VLIFYVATQCNASECGRGREEGRESHCVKQKVPAEVSKEGYTLYQRYQMSIRGIEQGSVGMMLPACIGCVSEMLQEEPGTNWTRAVTLVRL
jgi:hypothetical protein